MCEDRLKARYRAFKTALQYMGENKIAEAIRKEVTDYEEENATDQELDNLVDKVLDSLFELSEAVKDLKKVIEKMGPYADSGEPGPGYVNQDPDLR